MRDEHGRFPGRESLPFRAGFLHRPVVDEYAALLRKWASQIGIALPAPDRRFSVLLTHDVDLLGPEVGVSRAMRSIGSGLLRRRPLREALLSAARASGLCPHPWDNLDEVIGLDRQLTDRFSQKHCQPLYFFIAGGDSSFDTNYRLRDARIRSRLREVLASGAGIGLHASYASGINPTRVADERKELEDVLRRGS